jgi:hypothetical protein
VVRKLLAAAWLIGVPGVLLWVSSRELVAAMQIDTRRETAARIRPGMPRAEVERIVGGPAGSYRVWPDTARLNFVTGNQWPRVYVWESYHGRIEVFDGQYGIQDRGTGGLRGWSTSRGVVDSVRWSPLPKEERGWDPETALAASAVYYFGLTALLYGAVWLCCVGFGPSAGKARQSNASESGSAPG